MFNSSAQEHPGGSSIILRYAGKDATAAYEPIHPPDALDKNLPKDKHLGELDTAAAKEVARDAMSKEKTKDEIRIEKAQRQKPALNRILNLKDMEVGMVTMDTCHCHLTEAIGGSAEGVVIQGTCILFLSIRR
jgi:cytochrome b involved in lipid metabolism